MGKRKRKLVMESCYFAEEQLEALRARRDATRISMAEQIRVAVDQYGATGTHPVEGA